MTPIQKEGLAKQLAARMRDTNPDDYRGCVERLRDDCSGVAKEIWTRVIEIYDTAPTAECLECNGTGEAYECGAPVDNCWSCEGSGTMDRARR